MLKSYRRCCLARSRRDAEKIILSASASLREKQSIPFDVKEKMIKTTERTETTEILKDKNIIFLCELSALCGD